MKLAFFFNEVSSIAEPGQCGQ